MSWQRIEWGKMAVWLCLGAALGLAGCAETPTKPVAGTEQAGSEAAWLCLGAALGLAGCGETSTKPVAGTEQAGSEAALQSMPAAKFGANIGRWFYNRPGDPKAAAAAWGQACTDSGGHFVPVSVMVPGKGWCLLDADGTAQVLFGGWIDAASLAKPENLTAAATAHWFSIFYRLIAMPPKQTVEHVTELVVMGQPGREADGPRILRKEVRRDPDDARCALVDADGISGSRPMGAAWGEYRFTGRARGCVWPGLIAVVLVIEGAWSGDTGAAARGAALRQQIGQILASLPVGR